MTISKDSFESLRDLAIEKLEHHGRWCAKKGAVTLQILDADDCVSCNEFVMNGGICDPI